MKSRVAATIGPMTVGALIALAAFLWGSVWRTEPAIPSGSSTPSASHLPAPTEDTSIRLVMIVSPTLEPTIFSTVTPIPTATPTYPVTPPCVPGKAIEGEVCIESVPTKTPSAPTPIQFYPGEGLATPGVKYLWPRE